MQFFNMFVMNVGHSSFVNTRVIILDNCVDIMFVFVSRREWRMGIMGFWGC